MAISTTTTWEVRTTGSDTNGGGFVTGATGIDYSQQDTAQFNGTNLVIDGTTNTKITSATHNFVAADIGNLIQISAGTGFTTGFYQIISVASNAATLDRSPGAVSTSGGTWALGGALATPNKALGSMNNQNCCWVKSGTYIVLANVQAAATSFPANNVAYTRLVGYGSVRGDVGRATISLSTNTGLVGIYINGNGWSVENFIVNCNSLGTSQGISFAGYSRSLNCKILNFTSKAISAPTFCSVEDCEITGGTSASTVGITAVNSKILRCYVHNNACAGISIGQLCVVSRCLIINNTGASSDGITIQDRSEVTHCTIFGNGRAGIYNSSTGGIIITIRNNILANNGTYGLIATNAQGLPADPAYDGNAYYNNTSGTRQFADNILGIYANIPYTNTKDVILTANPFTNSAGGDFTLNAVAGGGAACKGSGTPGVLPGITNIGYPDMGCFQHLDQPIYSSN